MTPLAHSRRGPSGAHRWTVCAGSPNAEAGRPDNPSIYAATGTLYHKIIAECLKLGLEPGDYLGQEFRIDGYDFVFDEVFATPMRDAIDRVHDLAVGGELFVETRVDTSFVLPGEFGTCDVGIIHFDKKEIIIYDHKFGEGVAVTAVENLQCIDYAIGFWDTVALDFFATRMDFTDFDPHDIKVRIMIDQPRARVHDPEEKDDDEESDEQPVQKFTEWTVSMGELLDVWAPWFHEKALATVPEDAPRTPGVKQCFFCKAKSDCKARTEWFLDMARMGFEDLDAITETGVRMKKLPTDPRSITTEQRVVIAENRGAFLAWVREVHDSVIDDYMRGYETPGVKAIRGRKGPRQWADQKRMERFLVKALHDKAHTKKLLSPAQAEELLPAEQWEKINPAADIVQSEGKPTLVTETDPRAGIQTAREGFENLGDE